MQNEKQFEEAAELRSLLEANDDDFGTYRLDLSPHEQTWTEDEAIAMAKELRRYREGVERIVAKKAAAGQAALPIGRVEFRVRVSDAVPEINFLWPYVGYVVDVMRNKDGHLYICLDGGAYRLDEIKDGYLHREPTKPTPAPYNEDHKGGLIEFSVKDARAFVENRYGSVAARYVDSMVRHFDRAQQGAPEPDPLDHEEERKMAEAVWLEYAQAATGTEWERFFEGWIEARSIGRPEAVDSEHKGGH